MGLDVNFSKIPPEVQIAGFQDRQVLVQQLKILREVGLYETIMQEEQIGMVGGGKEQGAVSNKAAQAQQPVNIQEKSKVEPGQEMPSSSKSSKHTPQSARGPEIRTPMSDMLGKWKASCPFNFFLTRMPFEESSAGFAISFGGNISNFNVTIYFLKILTFWKYL
jgi:hypothetical protein